MANITESAFRRFVLLHSIISCFSKTHFTLFINVFIDTHDIQNILIDYKRRILRLKFLENSTAKGALLVVHRLKLDNLYCIFIPISRDIIEYSIPSFMSDSSLLAFDIEEEGYLMPGMNYPAKDPIEIPGTQNKSGKYKFFL